MTISDKTIKKMLKINFLFNYRVAEYPIILVKNLKEAEKSINSIKWENFNLEKTGDFTSFLSIKYPELDQYWNKLVIEVKKIIIPEIKLKLIKLVNEKRLTLKMIDQILFDIVTISVYLEYKSYISTIKSEFIEEIYELYKSGYIPCGYTNGKYKVL